MEPFVIPGYDCVRPSDYVGLPGAGAPFSEFPVIEKYIKDAQPGSYTRAQHALNSVCVCGEDGLQGEDSA